MDSKPLFTGEEWDDIYGMPPNALKVWLFHYRCEIDGRESWPGEDLICYKLRICRDTLADNRKWLKDHGWLVQLTEAYPSHNPTYRVERGALPLRGSKKRQANPLGSAPTVRSQANHSENSVDEPNVSLDYRRDELPSQRKKADANNASVKMRRKNTDAKVSGSSSVSVFSSVSSSTSARVGGDLSLRTPPAPAEKPTDKPKTQTENQKPKTRRVAKDGSPVPQDIDSWSLEKKLAWSQEHNGTGVGMSARPNKQETPNPKPQTQGVTRTGLGHFCDGDSIECENSAYNQVGNRWLCDPCLAEEGISKAASL